MAETYTPVITFGRYTCAIGLEAGTGKQRLVILVDYAGGAPPTPPVKTGNPSIAGTAQVGQTLTATHGTYTGTVTGYTSAWYSNGILAQTGGLTYIPVIGDIGNNITYQEAGYNTGPVYASATGTSNVLGPVIAAAGSTPALKFNVAANSQYLALVA